MVATVHVHSLESVFLGSPGRPVQTMRIAQTSPRAVAQFERDLIAERGRAGIAHARTHIDAAT